MKRDGPRRIRSTPMVAALLAGAALAAPWPAIAGEQLTIVEDGRPAATIVVPQGAGLSPMYAAGELRDHLRMMTGADLPIVTDGAEVRGTRILVGAGRLAEAEGIRASGFGPQEYLIAFRPRTLILAGADRVDDRWPVRVTGRLRRAEGRSGRSAEFGGESEAVSVAAPGFSDQAGALEAWVWLGDVRPDAGTIFRLDGAPWTYHIVDTQGEAVRYVVWDGKSGRSVTSPRLPSGWHHLRAVHDAAAGKMELLVDGASCGTEAYAATTCAGAPFVHLGAFVNDGKAANRFQGRIDEVRISRAVEPSSGTGPRAAADADTVVLLHFDEESGPPRESSGRPRVPGPPALEEAFQPMGTCYAVFDFLERFCGVRWYAPTELGMVVPRRCTLAVGGADIRRRPAFEFRHHAPSGIGYGARGLAGKPTDEELRRFIFRRRLGGKSYMTNHSFYDFYDRFWEKNPARPEVFEGRRPELFARGYDGRPPQLCYSSKALIDQVVADARARLDAGAEYVPLVPMDNDQQCRCDACQALLDRGNKSRQFSTGKASGLFWTFADAVAREVGKSHPGRSVSTIAYYDYAFPPTFDVEPNILVGPCLHSRNWWCPSMERNDLALYKGWCAKAPGRLACVWLYQCFPDEIGDVNRFQVFPGFHAHILSRQFRMFAADGVRGFFLCGVADFIDGYLTFRCLDDPSFDVDGALEEFFSLYYGPAAPPMKRLYFEIERTYMDPENYPEAVRKEDAHFHQSEEMAWKHLGTAERLLAWGKLLEEARSAASTPTERERVAVFEKDIWDRMVEGRKAWEAKAAKR